jgi:glycogen operon protein
VTRGSFFPLGATITWSGVNFALFSQHATAVTLVLFDGRGRPAAEIPLRHRTRFVWHAHVEGAGPGQLYGFRVDGPWAPAAGHRFNPRKLLLDPYARAILGEHRGDPARHLDYDPDGVLDPARLRRSGLDNGAEAPRCVVMDGAFDWRGDRPPGHPLEELVIWEAHVKGTTAHSSSGADFPGTYLGFIERIPHLVRLGVNAVELLPVHARHSPSRLTALGLSDYWGYNTVGFFAPDRRFAAGSEPGCEVAEFKELVRALHAAGIEVILDVVYNHTGEGDELGPALCFRGIDNAIYYKQLPGDPSRYADFTGCGNTLDLAQPPVLKLVMDSLRYWVEELHVDGFRFDLASSLGRGESRFDRIAAFFMAVHQDPVVSRVKLIAEPWDLGADSYQVGNFPVEWCEWNGRFRDTARRFVRGDPGQVPDLATRLAGSADLYGNDGRTPYHSINFVTCHDGFTLHDLTAYSRKHNEQNGEGNRDGLDDNASRNWGVEGETRDPTVLELRGRAARNLATILLVSQGVPMLLAGDELLRTQGGNNNAYCQDNGISWIDWRLARRNRGFLEFVRRLIALRRAHPVLRRRTFLSGADRDRDGIADIAWYDADGREPAWGDPRLRSLAFRVQGREILREEAETGQPLSDLFVALHAAPEDRAFVLPPPSAGFRWYRAVDTALPPGEDAREPGDEAPLPRQDAYLLRGHSGVVLVGR